MLSHRVGLVLAGMLVVGSVVGGTAAARGHAGGGDNLPTAPGPGALTTQDGGSCSAQGTVSAALAWSRCQTVSTYDYAVGTTCGLSLGWLCPPSV